MLQETILTGDFDQAAEMLGPGYHLAQQQNREKDGQRNDACRLRRRPGRWSAWSPTRRAM